MLSCDCGQSALVCKAEEQKHCIKIKQKNIFFKRLPCSNNCSTNDFGVTCKISINQQVFHLPNTENTATTTKQSKDINIHVIQTSPLKLI